MVLNETKQLRLIGQISTEMKANAFRITVLQSIVELLVVAEVKSLVVEVPIPGPNTPRR